MVPPRKLAKIRVVAPATLNEGYQFDVKVSGKTVTVTVPEGGVQAGESFEIPYYDKQQKEEDDDDDDETRDLGASNSDEDDSNAPPMGRWRHAMCSCCDVFTQATFWVGCCCAPLLVAQLVTRLGLSWKGLATDSKEEASMSFSKIVIASIICLIFGYIPIAGTLILLIFLLYLLVFVGGNLRNSMRIKYKIPATTYECIDDRMCMCFCGCCSFIQMARQTHDDKEWPGACCTTNGLEFSAPLIL
jgi:Cys-rich protein (TIGR01571 family)